MDRGEYHGLLVVSLVPPSPDLYKFIPLSWTSLRSTRHLISGSREPEIKGIFSPILRVSFEDKQITVSREVVRPPLWHWLDPKIEGESQLINSLSLSGARRRLREQDAVLKIDDRLLLYKYLKFLHAFYSTNKRITTTNLSFTLDIYIRKILE